MLTCHNFDDLGLSKGLTYITWGGGSVINCKLQKDSVAILATAMETTRV